MSKNHITPMSGQESLQIIQQMIETARQHQKDSGMSWIVWGWMLFITSVLTVINTYVHWTDTYIFWNLFGLATIVTLVIHRWRKGKLSHTRRVVTYISTIYGKLNLGFTVTLLTIVFAINHNNIGPRAGFALLIALYGFWMLIYGALYNFKPSVWGAYIAWALAITALLMPTFGWVMVCHALAVLAGYIVPGHIAFARYRKAGRMNNQNGNKSSV